jgi:hypothetical protein
MEFQVPCECGKDLTVSEAAADSRRQCPCGREVLIPSLKEMRLKAGLPAYNIPPEKLIEHMLGKGEVPGDGRCAGCGKPTEQVVHVETECEKSWTVYQRPPWATVLLGCFFWPVWVFVYLWGWGEKTTHGSDKSYVLPLSMCPGCLPAMTGAAAIKRCMWTVPVYRQLLDKFPDAKVRLIVGWQPQAGVFTPDR